MLRVFDTSFALAFLKKLSSLCVIVIKLVNVLCRAGNPRKEKVNKYTNLPWERGEKVRMKPVNNALDFFPLKQQTSKARASRFSA